MQPSPSAESDRSQRFDAHALKARVIAEAQARGAIGVRVADACGDESTRERLQASFDRGDLAMWPYDERYARGASDPQTILPNARSVICVAVPYATSRPQKGPLRGRVSNYAWSTDYHRRMRSLLYELAALLDEAAGGAVTAIACDTKPIAERAFAARAGLGWIGKHTNLIAPNAGSFVFLGEIITSIELASDESLRKTCGTCSRCISACPTGALRGDYTIDANRCIADLTQRTDPIPLELRPYIGDWVWGCDLCQEACPPVQRASVVGDSSFAAIDEEVAAPSLVSLLALRSGEFKRRYATTGMGWRGGAVLRRNAAIALGNALDRSAAPALVRSLESDPHPMVRGASAWALGRIGSPNALAALGTRALCETDASVRSEIEAALEPFTHSTPLGRT